MKLSYRQRFSLFFLLISLGSFIGLKHHEVRLELTQEDQEYIRKLLEIPQNQLFTIPKTYEGEIELIVNIQQILNRKLQLKNVHPLGSSREPRDIYEKQGGLCFDLSRLKEKVLRAHGFKTRHIFILGLTDKQNPLKALLTPGNPSHAVSEVLTQKGWLVLDSTSPWIALDDQREPVSLDELSNASQRQKQQWKAEGGNGMLVQPFLGIYGLYSRHGLFYPPYQRIPDVHYSELFQNLLNF